MLAASGQQSPNGNYKQCCKEEGADEAPHEANPRPVTELENQWIEWMRSNRAQPISVPGVADAKDTEAHVITIPPHDLLRVRRDLAVLLASCNTPVPKSKDLSREPDEEESLWTRWVPSTAAVPVTTGTPKFPSPPMPPPPPRAARPSDTSNPPPPPPLHDEPVDSTSKGKKVEEGAALQDAMGSSSKDRIPTSQSRQGAVPKSSAVDQEAAPKSVHPMDATSEAPPLTTKTKKGSNKAPKPAEAPKVGTEVAVTTEPVVKPMVEPTPTNPVPTPTVPATTPMQPTPATEDRFHHGGSSNRGRPRSPRARTPSFGTREEEQAKAMEAFPVQPSSSRFQPSASSSSNEGWGR